MFSILHVQKLEHLMMQSRKADLKGVVVQLRERFGLSYIFCWHAMHG